MPSAASVALAGRISRGSPSRALEILTEGAIGEAVAIAASYADDAISAVTRAAYLRDWAHFATWCGTKNADAAELPINPVSSSILDGARGSTFKSSPRCSRLHFLLTWLATGSGVPG